MHIPAVESVPVWKDKVADGEEVSRYVLKLEMKENSLTFREARRSSHNKSLPRDVRVVRVCVRDLCVGAIKIFQI